MSRASALARISKNLRGVTAQPSRSSTFPIGAHNENPRFLPTLPAPIRQNATGRRLPHARRHFERRTVPFTPSELFEVVADVNDYQYFVPWCTRSRVTSRVDDKHIIADLAVGFKLLSERYTSVITLDPNRSVSADVPDSSLFEYLITDWVFEPVDDITSLTFYVEFAFRNPLYQRVTDLFFQEVVKRMVSAFEKRCFEKYRATERRSGVLHRW